MQRMVFLMLTYSCNLNCIYCYQKHKTSQSLSLETAKTVVANEVALARQTENKEGITRVQDLNATTISRRKQDYIIRNTLSLYAYACWDVQLERCWICYRLDLCVYYKLLEVIENELEFEIDEDKRIPVRSPDDFIDLMGRLWQKIKSGFIIRK